MTDDEPVRVFRSNSGGLGLLRGETEEDAYEYMHPRADAEGLDHLGTLDEFIADLEAAAEDEVPDGEEAGGLVPITDVLGV